MTPETYTKKSVEVEAMQLIPGTDNYKDVCDWILANHPRRDDDVMVVHTGDSQGSVFVLTHHGMAEARPGDWILRGIDGEFYPCQEDVFAKTYEKSNFQKLVDAELASYIFTAGDGYPSIAMRTNEEAALIALRTLGLD